MSAAISEGIADMPHAAVFFFRHHFQIRYRCTEHGIPVHQSLATINQPLLMQANEHLGDGGRHLVVHREVLAAPVGGGAHAAHLTRNGRAGVFFPFPDFFQKFFATEIVARDLLCIQLALDDDLRRNTRMISAGYPGSVVAAHTVIARQAIHDGLVESVTHVKGAGHIGWRQLNGERGFALVQRSGEVAALFPFGAPVLFYLGGLEGLG